MSDVFASEVSVERNGHAGVFASSRQGRSYVDCDCGWSYIGASATDVNRAWSDHARSS